MDSLIDVINGVLIFDGLVNIKREKRLVFPEIPDVNLA